MLRKTLFGTTLALSLAAGAAFAGGHEANIVDTAKNAGDFTSLVTGIETAGLEGALAGDGPFTVFAPYDPAFAGLEPGALEALLNNKDDLNAVLTYHVVAGKVMAGDLADGQMLPTLNGKELPVQIMDGKVMIDGATVVSADVGASNGVIHVIDSVLFPGDDM
ncbi:fasciclin domain-containing protein [Palleronia caenipelagi]|uniref:Fasciclin domain-containing protein n=1 Tax=Palleronia caenipelagi TaxID=2489174 RepID=A0A547Q5D2_9RHOB|nr:fasciclin domain-containing protein [Palleronia caenipelagi]TRD21579.1 fasciclin domain-containing protein [Palleronia caenipelagi]